MGTVGPLTSMSLTTEPLRRPPPQLPRPPRKLPRKETTFAWPLRNIRATISSGPGLHTAGTVATQIAPLQGAFNSLRLEKPLVCEDASWQIALLYSDLVYMIKSRPLDNARPDVRISSFLSDLMGTLFKIGCRSSAIGAGSRAMSLKLNGIVNRLPRTREPDRGAIQFIFGT